MDIYSLSRNFFDWSFENPEKITPTHTALYFFSIEHCNRLGWKEKFGFPSQMAMEAIGIKSYNTYSKVFGELVEWGFFTIIQKSVNQYSANIIALSKNNKAPNKALDKALTKHKGKQRESNDSIDIQDTNIQYTNLQTEIVATQPNEYLLSIDYLKNYSLETEIPDYAEKYRDEWIKFCIYWGEKGKTGKIRAEGEKTFEIKKRFATWMSRKKEQYQQKNIPKESALDITL